MNELIDRKPAVEVEEPEYLRLLGYPPRHVLDGRSRELADWARNWFAANGQPWIYARPADGLELRHERLQIDGAELTSKSLHDQFHAAVAHSSVLVAVSAGNECEEKARELWQEE